jgi:hypothetical protein
MFVNSYRYIIACMIHVGESGSMLKDMSFLNFVVLTKHLIVHTDAIVLWTKCVGNKCGYVDNGATMHSNSIVFVKSTLWIFCDSIRYLSFRLHVPIPSV